MFRHALCPAPAHSIGFETPFDICLHCPPSLIGCSAVFEVGSFPPRTGSLVCTHSPLPVWYPFPFLIIIVYIACTPPRERILPQSRLPFTSLDAPSPSLTGATDQKVLHPMFPAPTSPPSGFQVFEPRCSPFVSAQDSVGHLTFPLRSDPLSCPGVRCPQNFLFRISFPPLCCLRILSRDVGSSRPAASNRNWKLVLSRVEARRSTVPPLPCLRSGLFLFRLSTTFRFFFFRSFPW